MALICDTGALYAAMDRNDRDHRVCAALIGDTEELRVVPAPVVVELDWLASRRLPLEAFDAFLSDVEAGAVVVEELGLDDYSRVRELVRSYADLPIGFVDAAVLAVTERLEEPKLATLDHRHFTVVRPRHVDALQLLPTL